MAALKSRAQTLALALPLLMATVLIYALSAGLVPQLDDVARPLTPDNHAYLALCHGRFAGIEEPFRFRILAPFLAGLAGDCTLGFTLLDMLCSAAASIAVALVAARLTARYAFRLLAGLLYLLLFCPRAHEAPWLTDALASAGSALAFAVTTGDRWTPLRWLALPLGLGRELLPPLFLRVEALVSALRARRLPALSSYAPALLGVAAYALATRIIGPQIGDLSVYVTDVLSDTAAKDDPSHYWAQMLRAMYFLWPYALAWAFARQPAAGARRTLHLQALLVVALSLFQSLLGGDIGRLFRLFALPVFIVAAIDVAANLGAMALPLGGLLALSGALLGWGLAILPAADLTVLSDALLAVNTVAVALAVGRGRRAGV